MSNTTGASDVLDPLIGTIVQDRYRVLSRLGEGGMGVVYTVEHVLIGRRFALKALDVGYSHDAEAVERFRREARAAAAIGDEHIVEVSDMGNLPNGAPYIVLELLEGHDLGVELKKTGLFSISRAVDITRQCCDALGSAHKKGIVHRDVKPDNIFLTKRRDGSDFVKILDFGISKFHEAAMELVGGVSMTRAGIAMGTPQYMSPEQVSASKDIDYRTDIYAMGAVLFEMLVGRTPFSDTVYPKLAIKIMNDPTPSLIAFRPDIPPELQAVVHRALAKEPANRFSSTAEFAEALAPFVSLASEPKMAATAHFDAATPKSWETLDLPKKEKISLNREKLLWLTAPAAIAVLVVGGIYIPRILQKNAGSIARTTSDRQLSNPSAAPPLSRKKFVFTPVPAK